MKKIYSVLLLISFAFLSLNGYSQGCTTCVTTDTISTYGFINLDSIPCIVQGETYHYAIPIRMYSTFTVGITVNIDSIEFIDIANLPCGLCWSTSSTQSNTFLPNQNGCILISGTTMDSVGQFQLAITLRAYYNGTSGVTVGPAAVTSSGIKLILRVVSPSGTCIPVDTSSSAYSDTTHPALCTTGINDIPGYISLFDVYPNPINSDAIVTFTALESGTYTLKLADVTGKTLRSQQLQATAGINKTDLPRQQLPSGIYFVSIGDEHGLITKKLLVTE